MKSLRNNAVLIALTIASPLLAQPAPAPAPLDEDAVVSAAKMAAELTPPAMRAKIDELDKKSEDDVRHVLRLQIVARKDKDVIRLNCINDKLLQIKALRNLLETAKDEFEGAIAGNNSDEQQHQFTKVTMSAENIRALREEANACAGEAAPYVGATRVDWEGPDIPDDPSQDLFDDGLEEPGYASPFM